MKETVSYHIMTLYRDFLAYTTEALKDLGIRFGQMPVLLWVGKHPGCSHAELTRGLGLDWGYSQRSITKLAEDGFLRKEFDEAASCNRLTLTDQGQHVFLTCHQVFQSWDRVRTADFSAEETETLLLLLTRLTSEKKEG